jgi:hypothetical protein
LKVSISFIVNLYFRALPQNSLSTCKFSYRRFHLKRFHSFHLGTNVGR